MFLEGITMTTISQDHDTKQDTNMIPTAGLCNNINPLKQHHPLHNIIYTKFKHNYNINVYSLDEQNATLTHASFRKKEGISLKEKQRYKKIGSNVCY